MEVGLDLFKPQFFLRGSHRLGMAVPERDKAPTRVLRDINAEFHMFMQ